MICLYLDMHGQIFETLLLELQIKKNVLTLLIIYIRQSMCKRNLPIACCSRKWDAAFSSSCRILSISSSSHLLLSFSNQTLRSSSSLSILSSSSLILISFSSSSFLSFSSFTLLNCSSLFFLSLSSFSFLSFLLLQFFPSLFSHFLVLLSSLQLLWLYPSKKRQKTQ